GEVFHARHIHTNNEFAVKLSPANNTAPILRHEYDVLCRLRGVFGIPNVISFGIEASHSVMIFDCLGPSLEEVFAIGDQLICRLWDIHLCNFIHRDIKPTNILISTGHDACTIYLIDFSIAKQYRDRCTHLHNAFKECSGSLGNPAFASINNHLGFELGRQDDIESPSGKCVLLYRSSLVSIEL
ncbi:kinase-like domain-containing protein, partial [Melanogaster broomeanus]